jgi:hypothetical protein
MKVPHKKGVANHLGPESCGGRREAVAEALTGEVQAGTSSRERRRPRCRRRHDGRKATLGMTAIARSTEPGVVQDPVHATKLLARKPGGPITDHEMDVVRKGNLNGQA